mgnify:CR=1 FL=1
MDKIIRPNHEGMYPDRNVDCQKAMDVALRELLDLATNAGWSIPETLDAIERVIPHLRKAYEADPDPADDAAAPLI